MRRSGFVRATVALIAFVTIVARSPSAALTDALYITAGGEVGIGTASPDPLTDLHISRPDVVLALVESTDNGPVQIRMQSDSANRRFLALNGSGVVESQIIFGDDGAITFTGQTVSETVLSVSSSGDVTAAGDIFSASCPSPAPCLPDYVFEPDYDLLPIDELAAFVSENRHLPNVPSENELRAAGKLNVSRFQMTLLEKIEELTLYTLHQQELIEELQARLEPAFSEGSGSR